MIAFDPERKIEDYTIVLSYRNHKHLGQLKNVDMTSVRSKHSMSAADELSFVVYKYSDEEQGVIEPLWDEITDFKYLWVKEFDEYFEITVDLNTDGVIKKTITAVSACEAELSQNYLHGMEINTQGDILREEYKDPTIFYNPEKPEASLLHRTLKVVPHYSVGYVDESLKKIQRTFTADGVDVYSFLTSTVADEIGVLFTFDSVNRKINAYDLQTVCNDCGYRGEYSDVCPECGSKNLKFYGEDTTVYVDTENLASNITFNVNTDNVKNCFKLRAGDDNMTAAVINCNPNGSSYMYYFSAEQKHDMSPELVQRLDDYDKLAKSYEEQYQKVMLDMYEAIDKISYYTSVMMPEREKYHSTSKKEAEKLTVENMSPIGLQEVHDYTSTATVDNALRNYAKVYVKSGYFKVQVNEGYFYYLGVDDKGFHYGNWEGNFKITNYSDEEDIAYSEKIVVKVYDNYGEFLQQKIEKKLANTKDEDGSVFDVLSIKDLDKFTEAIKLYCLNRLTSFYDAIQGVIDILIEEDQASQGAFFYEDIYLPYYNKLLACQKEIDVRDKTIKEWEKKLDEQKELQRAIQKILNFENYLGTELYHEFCCFRRESEFANDNYISDGFTNSEIFEKANEFLDVARKELVKSGEHQHQITATLLNLLAMDEFAPLKNKFALGNFIRVGVDGEVYRLRLVSYEINFSDTTNIGVEFSDVTKTVNGVTDMQSVLDKAQGMATTYDSYKKQVKNASDQAKTVEDWVQNGLDLTGMKIVNQANGQNFQINENGILARRYDDITETYDPCQMKLINNGLYLTEDDWRSLSVAIGKSVWLNPETGVEEEFYGIVADKIFGQIITGNTVQIRSNDDSFILDENGVTIGSGNINWSDDFKINIGNVNGLPEILDKIDANLTSVTILTTGTKLTSVIPSVTLSARFVKNFNDVTESTPAASFFWYRNSGNETDDTAWNRNHQFMKEITLTSQDVEIAASFECRVDVEGHFFRSGFMTISNETSIEAVDVKLSCNYPTFQIDNGGILYPQWTDLQITPELRGITGTDYTVQWKRRVGVSAETDLIEGETVTDNKLVITKNMLSEATPIITYICTVTYKNVPFRGEMTFVLTKNGEPGQDGEGASNYTWIRYADDVHGNGISDDPTNKYYIGIASNKPTAEESNNPADYQWARFAGLNSKSLELSSTAYVVPFKSDGSLKDPTEITLTANLQNDNSAITWETNPKEVGLTTVDSKTKLLNPMVFSSYDKVEILVSAGTLSDKITIVKVQDGNSGDVGYTVVLTNETQTIATDKDLRPINAESYTTKVRVYKGAVELAASNGTAKGTFKVITPPSQDNIIVSQPTLGTIEFAFSNLNPIPADGSFDIQVIIEGAIGVNKIYNYAVSKQGEQGLPGDSGQSLESMTMEYYLSDSKVDLIGGSWSNTPPTWVMGKYIWTRYKMVWVNPSATKFTEPICDSSWDVLNEMEVGGRNLLRKTYIKPITEETDIVNTNLYTVNGSLTYECVGTGSGGFYFDSREPMVENSVYAVNFKIRAANGLAKGLIINKAFNHGKTEVYFDGIKLGRWGINYQIDLFDGLYHDVFLTFETSKNIQQMVSRTTIADSIIFIGEQNFTVDITDLVWQKGNKTTGWDIAPEDSVACTIVPTTTSFITVKLDDGTMSSAPNNILMTPALSGCSFKEWQYSLNGLTFESVVGVDGLTVGLDNVLNIDTSSPIFKERLSVVFKVLTDVEGLFDISTITNIIDPKYLEEQLGEIQDKLDKVTITANTAMTQISSLNGSIIDTITQTSATIVDEALVEVNKEIIQFKETIAGLDVTTIKERTDAMENVLDEYSEYLHLGTDYISLGKSTSSIRTVITNDKFAIQQDGIDVAYVSANKLFIQSALILNDITVGDDNNGYYRWKLRTNGNFSLTYSEGV